MPSRSLHLRQTDRRRRLDEIAAAHAAIGGEGPGRRVATQQVNYAYAVLLSAEFQAFCRDLHSECVDHIVRAIARDGLRQVARAQFLHRRMLDRGNPSPGNIETDFNRLGLRFWDAVQGYARHGRARRVHLESLNMWRNAISHQDFDARRLGGSTKLWLKTVRTWHRACDGLTVAFDAVMADHVGSLVGSRPW